MKLSLLTGATILLMSLSAHAAVSGLAEDAAPRATAPARLAMGPVSAPQKRGPDYATDYSSSDKVGACGPHAGSCAKMRHHHHINH
jgi:hypothetical protein